MQVGDKDATLKDRYSTRTTTTKAKNKRSKASVHLVRGRSVNKEPMPLPPPFPSCNVQECFPLRGILIDYARTHFPFLSKHLFQWCTKARNPAEKKLVCTARSSVMTAFQTLLAFTNRFPPRGFQNGTNKGNCLSAALWGKWSTTS